MKKLIILLFVLLYIPFCKPQEPILADISLTDYKIKLVPDAVQNTAMFVKITNPFKEAVSLVKAESDISESVELHNMVMENEVMVMRPVEKMTVPADGTLELKPGSYHVMFINLKAPLKVGDVKKVTLTFDNGKVITVDAPVVEVQAGHEHKH